MENKSVYDITNEFLQQFKKEDVITFFEFQFLPEEIKKLHGLCKISKPKGKTSFNYISLVFIADTPSPSERSAVNSALHNLTKLSPESIVEGLESIIALPDTSVYKEHIVVQFDMIFKPDISAETGFIINNVIPSICNICGIESIETIPWDDSIDKREMLKHQGQPQNITSVFKNIINELKI